MDFSVSMALVDFLPVIFFGVSAVIFQRDLYNKMSKGAFALFATGTTNIICAGGCKALHKLLYALNICDWKALSAIFFPMQSLGFLFAGLGAIAMLYFRQHSTKKVFSLAAVPPVFSGTFVFVFLMCAGLFCIDYGIAIISKRMKKGWLIILVVISFCCSLCMGYLSARDFSQAFMNWLCEGINVVGQGTLMATAIILHRNGLEQYELREKKA